MILTTNTHTHTTVLRLYGFCLGQPGWNNYSDKRSSLMSNFTDYNRSTHVDQTEVRGQTGKWKVGDWPGAI